MYIILYYFFLKTLKKTFLYIFKFIDLVKISVKLNNKFETNKFWWVLLNLWDDQNNSLNIFVITNWKKLKINIKEKISMIDQLL